MVVTLKSCDCSVVHLLPTFSFLHLALELRLKNNKSRVLL